MLDLKIINGKCYIDGHLKETDLSVFRIWTIGSYNFMEEGGEFYKIRMLKGF